MAGVDRIRLDDPLTAGMNQNDAQAEIARILIGGGVVELLNFGNLGIDDFI